MKRFARVLRGEPLDDARNDCLRTGPAGEFEPVLWSKQIVGIAAHGADAFGAACFKGACAGRVIRWGHGFNLRRSEIGAILRRLYV